MNKLYISLCNIFIAIIILATANPSDAQTTPSNERYLTTNCESFKYQINSNPNQPNVQLLFGKADIFFLGDSNFEIIYQAEEDFIGTDSLEIEFWVDPWTFESKKFALHIYECGTTVAESNNCEAYEFTVVSNPNPPQYSAQHGVITSTFLGNDEYKCVYTPFDGFEGIDELEVITWSNTSTFFIDNVKVNVTNCEMGVTSIKETLKFEGTVFPNPTRNIVIIENIPEDVNSLELYDLTGRLLKQELINDKETEISIQNFENGMYVLLMKGTQNYRQIITKM